MTEQFVTYFGYGSLVNRNTRPASEQAYPARLYGWRRVWGHRVHTTDESSSESRKSCCSLSVEKSTVNPGTNSTQSPRSNEKCGDFIDGVVVNIPLDDLAALDRRECGYDRLQIPASDFDLPSSSTARHIYLYVSDLKHAGRSNRQYPILQSYIDCVLAGYCAVFNQTGMQQFVESTIGWDGVIENERSSPRYPRAVQLSESQLALFDSVVNNHRSN